MHPHVAASVLTTLSGGYFIKVLSSCGRERVLLQSLVVMTGGNLQAAVPSLSVQFFNFVALPLFQTLSTAFPACLPLLTEAKSNLAS